MTITFTSGTITTDATEKTIWDITADEHYAGYIFCHNMQAGDSVTVKVYVRDTQSGTMRIHTTAPLTGVQPDPSFYIPFMPAKEHKVTIQRTAGTDRAFTWQRSEVG